MEPTLPPDRTSRHYTTRESVAVRYMRIREAASPGAAHQQQLAFEREFRKQLFDLSRAGKTQALRRLRDWINEELDPTPVIPIRDALLSNGRVQRSQAEAREACLANLQSVAAMDLYIQRTRREIAELEADARSAAAYRETLRHA